MGQRSLAGVDTQRVKFYISLKLICDQVKQAADFKNLDKTKWKNLLRELIKNQ